MKAHTLTQNVAPVDRTIRAVIGVLLVLALPAVVKGPWWLSILGGFGGVQIITAINGY
jgi:hypothetical protein